MITVLSFLSFLTLVLAESQESQSVNILHRRFHPIHAPDAPYTLRGTVRLGSTASSAAHEYTEQFRDHLNGLFTKDISLADSSWLYQVALERPGELDVSSIKACHLTTNSSEQLTIHLSPRTHLPHAIDYFVSPVPSDGSCHSHAGQPLAITKSTVNIKSANAPPLPIFREPPRLAADGGVEKPLPEKTFIEKYWMYFVGLFIALALSGGSEEPKK